MVMDMVYIMPYVYMRCERAFEPDCNEHFILNYGFMPHYCQAELLGEPVQLAP